MSDLVDPAISLLLLFRANEQPKQQADAICRPWLESRFLVLDEETVAPESRCVTGQKRADGTHCRLDYCLAADDTHLLRLVLTRAGAHPAQAWAELTGLLNEAARRVWEEAGYPRPWAGTQSYLALLPDGTGPEEARRLALAEEGPALDARAADDLEGTPFGWLGKAGDQRLSPGGMPTFLRRLLVLVPEDRAAQVRKSFLEPMDQGLARIELYLHKALHHARLYAEPTLQADATAGGPARALAGESRREQLEAARQVLEETSDRALKTLDFSQVHRERLELEAVTRELMLLLAQKGRVEILLNSLDINLRNVRQHLEYVKLESPLYLGDVRRLEGQREQIQADLRYADATVRAAQTIQDIQHGEEAMRLERSSFLLGGAAAVLAGVAIFDSFLDIWNLAVEKSAPPVNLPSPLLRVALGLAAAVGGPAAAYWAVERRWLRAVAASLLVLLAVGLAIVSTMWVNR